MSTIPHTLSITFRVILRCTLYLQTRPIAMELKNTMFTIFLGILAYFPSHIKSVFSQVFSHQILNATYQGLLAVFPTKRPFIIGRSTFAGSGKWAGHWGGDNASKWYYMYFSIPQALSFSLFGIPMFGVDTCGFNGNSDEELCNRWMQLSAFFPFYRNHNVLSANSQEPYVWDSVIAATKEAMHIRYRYVP